MSKYGMDDYIGLNYDDRYYELDSATYSASGKAEPNIDACAKIWPLLYGYAETCEEKRTGESLIWETCIRFSLYADSVEKDDRVTGCNGRVTDLLYCMVLICKEELLCRMGHLDRKKRTFARK